MSLKGDLDIPNRKKFRNQPAKILRNAIIEFIKDMLENQRIRFPERFGCSSTQG